MTTDHTKCTEHIALVKLLEVVQGAIVKEEKQRETAFTVLNNEMKAANEKIGKLDIRMAKLMAGIAVALGILQVILKFLPIGGTG
jgi:hypothetical protein